MRIAIGADHRGYTIKEYIKQHITSTSPEGHQADRLIDNERIEWIDVGAHVHESSDDYPAFAIQVAQLVSTGQVDCGIMICGSGMGMVIAANRYHGIYAATVWNVAIAQFAKQHDNVNVLSIPADFVSQAETLSIVYAWLNACFLGGKYKKRIDMIDQIRDAV